MKKEIILKENGITLIGLIVTIIIILIIAGISMSVVTSNNNFFMKSAELSYINEILGYKELLQVKNTEIKINIETSEGKEQSLSYNILIGEELKNNVSGIPDEMINKLALIGDSIVYLTDVIDEDALKAEEYGYTIINPNDLEYMIELQMVENAIYLIQKYDYINIGKELETLDYPETVTLASTYGKGWWILGARDTNEEIANNAITELEGLGYFVITEEEKQYFKHSPYIFTYEEQYVQSIGGKNTNKDTIREMWRYSYNYNGELNGFSTNGLVVVVKENSEKTTTSWGEFEYSEAEAEFSYETDKYGNQGLVTGESTASMQIEENVRIHEAYTASLLVKGTTTQHSNERVYAGFFEDNSIYFGNTLLAISDNSGKYTCWMSLSENNLRIHAYSGIDGKMPDEGYLTIDVSEYNDKYMYIQLVVTKGGEAKLYINGINKATFAAGKDEMVDRIISIGDLRPERNLKYSGIIYEIDLYAKSLEESELQENWKYIQSIYHIDEFGNQE